MVKNKNKFIFLIILVLSLVPAMASANEIKSIDISASLRDNGDMDIVQVWDVYTSENTEFYIPMQALNHMGIENYRVSMNGQAFEEESNWDIDGSFDDKAYKYGINESEGYPELCFGISDYGDNTYTIEYTFTNAVQAFTDYDGFNVRFVNDNMKPTPGSVDLTIEVPGVDLTQENSGIWGFGYDGEVVFEAGQVVARTNDFNFYNYMNILMRLDKGILNPTYEGRGSFDTLYDEAIVNSDYTSTDDLNEGGVYEGENSQGPNFGFFIPFILPLLGIITAISGVVASRRASIPRNLKEVKISKGDYYRQPPLDDHLPALSLFNGFLNKSKFEDMISAFMLKWINEGAIEIQDSKVGLIFKRQSINIKFIKNPEFSYTSERELFLYLTRAAEDNILEEKELQSYVSKHSSQFKGIEKTVRSEAMTYSFGQAYLAKDKRGFNLTDSGKEEVRRVEGFKDFLQDFTLINEREPIEVKLWDKLLISAAALGLAETVSKQFETIYPEYNIASTNTGRSSNLNYSTLYYVSRIAGFSSTANASYQAAQVQRSSGGGGGSSFRGGGGFSGGGSGGGSR